MKNFLHALKSNHGGKQQRPLILVAMLMCFYLISASAQTPSFTRNECGCLNNETSWGNGQFAETITITGAPGVTWTVVAANGLYSTASPAPPAAPLAIPAGTVIAEEPAGSYVFNARRVDNTNYSLIVSDGTNQYTVNSQRTCRYPRNEILGDIGACVTSPNKVYRIDVLNTMLPSIAWTISGGGSTVGPSNTNSLTVNWGTTVGSYKVRVNGTARAFPGQTSGFCTIKDSVTVDIANEPAVALACNNLIHVSMNGRCELNVTPGMVLEDMLLPASSYDVILRDIEKDTIIPNTRISQKYLSKLIEARVVQECSQNSCWGLVKLEDKSIPTLVCNPDVTIECNQLTGPQVTGFPLKPDAIVTPISGNKFLVKNFDFCSDVVLEYFDEIKMSDCVGEFSSVVTRKWLVTDISGNSNTCASDIYIRKANSGDIVFPTNWDDVLGPNPSLPSCGNWPKLANGHPDPAYTGSPQGIFCMNVTVDFQDTRIAKCRGDKTFKLLRKWIVSDLCNGTQIIRSQTITVMDKVAPVIAAPNDFTVGTTGLTCASQIKLPHPTITDCGNTEYYVSYVVPDLNGLPSSGPGTQITDKNPDGTYLIKTIPAGVTTLWVTYLAVDDCDNASEDVTRVDIVDSTPPVPVCDQFSFAGLNGDGVGFVTVESLDDGSWDNCGINYLEARRMETSSCGITNNWAPKIKFCCEDAGKSFTVQLRVVDKAGNSNTCMVEVRVQDNVPPTLTGCPNDITVDCSADLLSLGQYGKPTASDVCSVSLTEEVKQNGFDDCGRGSISRIFTATDNFGNKTSCTQVITVRPSNPFKGTDITWPLDHTFTSNGCLNTGIEPDNMPAGKKRPVWNVKPCSQIAVEYEDIVFQYVEGFCFKVLRKWTVIDWCQFNPLVPNAGKWTYTQVIKGQNNIAPTITKGCVPSDVKITQVDNCQALIEVTATATDDCTKPDKFVWNYTLDIGNNGTIDFTGNTNTVSRTVGFGKHTVKWTVTDECGNSKTCNNTFEVKDQKKPTPYCLSEITTVIMEQDGNVAIWASDFNAGSYDNCSPNPNLKYSFSTNVNETSRVFKCADMTDNVTRFELRIYVTDDAGNQDFCTTHINVQDNNNTCGFGIIGGNGDDDEETSKKVNVTGSIRLENNESIENVMLMLESQQPEFPRYVFSNAEGAYSFNELTELHDYTITPSKNDDYLNGLSTLDLVLMQRHILGVKKLESPYKIIACDANSDDRVTAADLVALRKLILGLTDKLPNSDGWKFVDKSYVFSDPGKPFPYQSKIGMSNLDHNVENGDFIAVKVGDINDSYQRNAAGNEAENRSRTTIQYTTTAVKAGEEITIPFELNEGKATAGLQMSMVFDVNKLDFKGIAAGSANISDDDIYLLDNTLLMSWADSRKENDGNTKLFGLTFVAKQDISAGEWFNLNDRMLKSEIYFNEDDNINASSIELELRGKSTGQNSSFELYQNTPNPFNHTTTIGFTIPEAGEVSFKVYDYNGTVLKQFRKHYERGYNTIELNVSEFNKAGILFYQLDSKTHSANKKMIVIK